MRSSIFRPTILAIALALSLAGTAQASAPHSSSAANDSQRIAMRDTADSRTNRNVDYPSQLGPEGPQAASTAEPMTTDTAQAALTSSPATR